MKSISLEKAAVDLRDAKLMVDSGTLSLNKAREGLAPLFEDLLKAGPERIRTKAREVRIAIEALEKLGARVDKALSKLAEAQDAVVAAAPADPAQISERVERRPKTRVKAGEIDEGLIKRMHGDGLTDIAISNRLGSPITPRHVADVRRKLGLKGHNGRPKKEQVGE